jgi:NCAIR mutase (PurE)-related protein
MTIATAATPSAYPVLVSKACAAGVTVVNIDNGFGAGVAASLINRR